MSAAFRSFKSAYRFFILYCSIFLRYFIFFLSSTSMMWVSKFAHLPSVAFKSAGFSLFSLIDIGGRLLLHNSAEFFNRSDVGWAHHRRAALRVWDVTVLCRYTSQRTQANLARSLPSPHLKRNYSPQLPSRSVFIWVITQPFFGDFFLWTQ